MPYCLYNVMFILLQCLAVQPDRDKRYSTAADFSHQDLEIPSAATAWNSDSQCCYSLELRFQALLQLASYSLALLNTHTNG